MALVSPTNKQVDNLHCPAPAVQKYEFVELFAGRAWASRCMRGCGLATASFDLDYGSPHPNKQNAMDLLSDAGFSFLSCIGYLHW